MFLSSSKCTLSQVRRGWASRQGGPPGFVLDVLFGLGEARGSGVSLFPVHAYQIRCFTKSGVAFASEPAVSLRRVPELPFLGSMVPFYSGIPAFDSKRVYEFFPKIQQKYGGFYSMGFPGLGVGMNGRLYVLSDPNEMMKVFRAEGSYPFGFIQQDWATLKWLKNVGSPLVNRDDNGFFGNGETWKRLRLFLQTDLLSPVAAKGYVPGMVQAARLASSGAPACTKDFRSFVSRCSLDLFSSVMFGELTNIANPKSPSYTSDREMTNESKKFCDAVMTALSDGTLVDLFLSPYEIAMGKFNINTRTFKKMEKDLSLARDIARGKIMSFIERKKHDELNEYEKASYFAHAIERQAAEGGVSIDEMVDLSMVLLLAAVDTTSSILHWTIVHLALSTESQERLYQELIASIENNGNGMLCEKAIQKKNAPYLHAVLREQHRLTPALFLSQAKKNVTSEIEIHGVKFPKGTMFVLDAHSAGLDPDLVKDSRSFKPERWLEDAVESRRGTPSEVIDHPLFRDGFSHGARKCPGSRAANYEALVMISQLILDWKIDILNKNIKTWEDVQYAQEASVQPRGVEFCFVPRKP